MFENIPNKGNYFYFTIFIFMCFFLYIYILIAAENYDQLFYLQYVIPGQVNFAVSCQIAVSTNFRENSMPPRK